MTNDQLENRALETLFETARDTTPDLDNAFVDRLMPVPTESKAQPTAHTGGFDLKGWFAALGGLGMATALGVWIGIAVPIDTLLEMDTPLTGDTFDLVTFYAGADPGVFFNDETGL